MNEEINMHNNIANIQMQKNKFDYLRKYDEALASAKAESEDNKSHIALLKKELEASSIQDENNKKTNQKHAA